MEQRRIRLDTCQARDGHRDRRAPRSTSRKRHWTLVALLATRGLKPPPSQHETTRNRLGCAPTRLLLVVVVIITNISTGLRVLVVLVVALVGVRPPPRPSCFPRKPISAPRAESPEERLRPAALLLARLGDDGLFGQSAVAPFPAVAIGLSTEMRGVAEPADR